MSKRIASGVMLTILFLGMLIIAFNIETVYSSGTIYIRADGSIDPETAPIASNDNYTYALVGDVNDPIVVERDNIVVDGAGYTVQGTGIEDGILLEGRSNVTIKNAKVQTFRNGIKVHASSDITIYRNIITNTTRFGIKLYQSSGNTISECNITNNRLGVMFWLSSNSDLTENNIENNSNNATTIHECSNNLISRNNMKNNGWYGIGFGRSSNNTITENNIIGNLAGISFYRPDLPNNKFFHNNFIDNIEQVDMYTSTYAFCWDNGYPSGGNYWSDYNGTDFYSGPYQNETNSDEIGDEPYVIDENNKDNYPLMNPWTVGNSIVKLIKDVENMNLQQGIDNSLDAKLDAALESLDAFNADKRNDAVNKLCAFVNEVEAQRGKKLTDEQADYLIIAAQQVIDLLEG